MKTGMVKEALEQLKTELQTKQTEVAMRAKRLLLHEEIVKRYFEERKLRGNPNSQMG